MLATSGTQKGPQPRKRIPLLFIWKYYYFTTFFQSQAKKKRAFVDILATGNWLWAFQGPVTKGPNASRKRWAPKSCIDKDPRPFDEQSVSFHDVESGNDKLLIDAPNSDQQWEDSLPSTTKVKRAALEI